MPSAATLVTIYDLVERRGESVAIVGTWPRYIYLDPKYGLYIAYIAPPVWRIVESTRELVAELNNSILKTKKHEELNKFVKSVFRIVYDQQTLIVYIDIHGELTVRELVDLKGIITSQFAMDLYNDTLRVVLWRPHGGFNLYVLDPTKLKVLSNMSVILPGERVYGVRFIGPYLYIVTFKRIDPLYVIRY